MKSENSPVKFDEIDDEGFFTANSTFSENIGECKSGSENVECPNPQFTEKSKNVGSRITDYVKSLRRYPDHVIQVFQNKQTKLDMQPKVVNKRKSDEVSTQREIENVKTKNRTRKSQNKKGRNGKVELSSVLSSKDDRNVKAEKITKQHLESYVAQINETSGLTFENVHETAKETYREYKKSKTLWDSVLNFFSCFSCGLESVENTTPVSPQVLQLVDHLEKNCYNDRHLFRASTNTNEHVAIVEMLRKNSTIYFKDFTPIENAYALKTYIRYVLDGILDNEMSDIILNHLLDQEVKGRSAIRHLGKLVIVQDRLKLLYRILLLFKKIDLNENNTEISYHDLVKSIAPLLFPEKVARKAGSNKVKKAAKLLCDLGNIQILEALNV